MTQGHINGHPMLAKTIKLEKFSDENNKLETYVYINVKKKYKCPSETFRFEIFTIFSLWTNKKRKKFTNIYIYIYTRWGRNMEKFLKP